MSQEIKKQVKTRLHPRNKNRERYDLQALIQAIPELKNHVKPSKQGMDTIDFANPRAVKLLNQALLHHYYGIKKWDFPDENLCPPIPGRADYLHHMADLLAENNEGNIPTGDRVTCLDVGVGASCIYPIIGVTEYDWQFIGCDVDSKSLESAQRIIDSNPQLENKISCRLQNNPKSIFRGILEKNEKIDLSICNPPFHSSKIEAQKGSRRKIKNLSGRREKTPTLNFSGVNNELIYFGGEYQFIINMIRESEFTAKNCLWFTTLVSKQSNVERIYKLLDKTDIFQLKTIPMGTGNKSSRIVAWTFLSSEERQAWGQKRWQ